ncbi:MAG: 4'-phosphopantetheinyl transferase superfamily protein [Spirochaetales bacterium]|nr:4'-phosphopantetheinyl transferase superfamily protein [Spirochaetales bacterium]
MKFVGEKKEERILKFRRREDAERTLVGDAFIRTIVCNQFHLKNSDLEFECNEYGKPFVMNIPDFHYNLSHSGKWVACAIDYEPLGIDVEGIRPIDFSIAERFFSKTEYEDLIAKPEQEQLEYFYDLWTLKESYIKARGKGLSLPLSSFSIRKDRTGITIESENEESWYFVQYPIDPGYKFSVCAGNFHFPVEVELLTPEELAGIMTSNGL